VIISPYTTVSRDIVPGRDIPPQPPQEPETARAARAATAVSVTFPRPETSVKAI